MPPTGTPVLARAGADVVVVETAAAEDVVMGLEVVLGAVEVVLVVTVVATVDVVAVEVTVTTTGLLATAVYSVAPTPPAVVGAVTTIVVTAASRTKPDGAETSTAENVRSGSKVPANARRPSGPLVAEPCGVLPAGQDVVAAGTNRGIGSVEVTVLGSVTGLVSEPLVLTGTVVDGGAADDAHNW